MIALALSEPATVSNSMKAILACLIIGTMTFHHASAAEQTGAGSSEMGSPDVEVTFPEAEECIASIYPAAKLPSLRIRHEDEKGAKFRLALLPSFTKPLFFTYSRNDDGASIEVKRLGVGLVNDSVVYGDLELTGTIMVGKRIARKLEENVVHPEVRKPWGDIPEGLQSAYYGVDGSVLMLEVSTERDYTMVPMWSPWAIGNIAPEHLERWGLEAVDTSWFIEFYENVMRITDMSWPEMGAWSYSTTTKAEDRLPTP